MPITIFLTLVILFAAGLAVDLTLLAYKRQAVQAACDAAALAGAAKLMDCGVVTNRAATRDPGWGIGGLGEGRTPPGPPFGRGGVTEVRGQEEHSALLDRVLEARAEAQYFAALNHIGDGPLKLDANFSNAAGGDIVVGWLEEGGGKQESGIGKQETGNSGKESSGYPVPRVGKQKAGDRSQESGDEPPLAPEYGGGGWLTPWEGRGPVNSVIVRSVRSRERGNPLTMWFGKFVGIGSADLHVSAQATLDQRVYGFAPVDRAPAPFCPIVIRAYGKQGWWGQCGKEFRKQGGEEEEGEEEIRKQESGIRSQGQDRYTVDERTGKVTPGSDGIAEVCVRLDFENEKKPKEKKDKGNGWLVRIGNGAGQEAGGGSRRRGTWNEEIGFLRQIEEGLYDEDLADREGELALDETGMLTLEKETVEERAVEALVQALGKIHGQKRIWPLGTQSASGYIDDRGKGACHVVEFAAGELVDCRRQGDGAVVFCVQPCVLQTRSALTRPQQPHNPWIGKVVLTR